MVQRILEGTWEEILRQGANLAGHRVRVTVLPDSPRLEQTLDKALAGYVGMVKSGKRHNMSERVEEIFGEYVAKKHDKREPKS